ncbi:hypothetical protein AHAS_Ahas12G0079300 [Arachis hypogaea]
MDKHKNEHPEFKTWCTMILGKTLQFGMGRVKEILQLPPSRDYPHSFNRRAKWIQVARGWLEFIQCSILSTSNRSEVTVRRAVMIHCIMLGNKVKVHQVIPLEIYNIVAKTSILSRLAFPHLIFCLCEATKVQIDRDILITVDRPITKKSMEYTRKLGQAQPQKIVLPSQKKQPEWPQAQDLPPREKWTQLEVSIGQLISTMDQLKEKHKNQSTILHKLTEEQKKQRHELEELKCQKGVKGPSGESSSHHE